MTTATAEKPTKPKTANKGRKPRVVKDLPEPFSKAVSQRLRKLAELMSGCETKRTRCFKNRDEVQEEIDRCNSDEKEKLADLKAAHYDEVREIERLNTVIKATKDKILDTIEAADQLEFESMVDANPTIDSLFDEPPAVPLKNGGKSKRETDAEAAEQDGDDLNSQSESADSD